MMADRRRYKARWLTRRIAAAHAVLADPTASDQRRKGARCRINKVVSIMRALPPISPMRRELEVDRLTARRSRSSAVR